MHIEKTSPLVYKSLHGIMWHSGGLDYIKFYNVLPKDVKAEHFPKGTENCKVLSNSMHKEVEYLNDHRFHIIRDLVDPKADEKNEALFEDSLLNN